MARDVLRFIHSGKQCNCQLCVSPLKSCSLVKGGKKHEQDFTNLAYGRATVEAENYSVATSYRTGFRSACNDTSPFETVQYTNRFDLL